MRNVLLPLLFGALTLACASHDGTGDKQRQPETKVDPRPQIELRAAIASVSLVRDCPDPPPSPAPTPSAASESATKMSSAMPPSPGMVEDVAPGAAVARGDSGGPWSPPCQQSTMQLTLAHDAKESQTFAIKQARLTAAGTGAVLGTVPVRGPMRWDDAGRYVDWDQALPGGSELKVSYRLGEPDWGLVSKALGVDDTHGKRYVLEVDVVFDGRTVTLRAPEFEREREHVIVT